MNNEDVVIDYVQITLSVKINVLRSDDEWFDSLYFGSHILLLFRTLLLFLKESISIFYVGYDESYCFWILTAEHRKNKNKISLIFQNTNSIHIWSIALVMLNHLSFLFCNFLCDRNITQFAKYKSLE